MRQNAKEGAYQATTCNNCETEAQEGTGFPFFRFTEDHADGGAYLCRKCWGLENVGRAKEHRRPWAGTVSFPENLMVHVLRYRWSVSRSDGYNVITISENGTRYATARGGGYDMTGAALADWLTARYRVRLAQLAQKRAGSVYSNGKYTDRHSQTERTDKKPGWKPNPNYLEGSLYGLTYNAEKHSAHLDGACGVSSVCKVLEALGLKFTEDQGNFGRKGRRRDEGVYFVAPINCFSEA